MNLKRHIEDLLREIGAGWMTTTAYDTAWVAQLVELNEPIGIQALDWLRTNQLPDGSWGAAKPAYHHDRLVSTLAATISIAKYGNSDDAALLERAIAALRTITTEQTTTAYIETIGFELITPTLFEEATKLKLFDPNTYEEMDYIQQQRAKKLARLPKGLINREFTLAFSSEMAGTDNLQILDVENLQEANGSVAHSPSATAYFALKVRPNNERALNYLRTIPSQNGGMPNVYKFDVFEPAWVLWNLSITNMLDETLSALCQPHLDFLEKAWKPGIGIAHAADFTPKDGDDTGLVFEVLSRANRSIDIEAVLHYELEDYFQCFGLESNPSISANIHILGALREAGFSVDNPAVGKIIRFLNSAQYWFDKWHISPYYPTTHAIIAAAGYVDELIVDAVDWILQTQNADGSWGFYMPTAEETAYCLQAIAIWKRLGNPVDPDVLRRGADWLVKNHEQPYPPLWIGKCLYAPVQVIWSSILSALALVSETVGERI